MVLQAGPTRRGLAGTKLRDYEIQSAAESGQCAGAQSFRAVARCDGAPVLLHRFRPANSLLDLGPILECTERPDFTQPFVTRFTDVFAAAASAYLVEPLPVCVSLSDIWRYVLLNRSEQAFTVVAILLRHLLTLVRRLADEGQCHGAIGVDTIVLPSGGSFGVLAGSVRCEGGLLWLRKDPREPTACDFRSLAKVLHCLLDMEVELAYLRNTSLLLGPAVRDGMTDLARTIEQTRLRART
jgi:hypothetical protein